MYRSRHCNSLSSPMKTRELRYGKNGCISKAWIKRICICWKGYLIMRNVTIIKKEVRNLLFSYFELETADTPAKQSLRKAILEEPPAYRRKKRMLLLLVLLAALSAVLIPALLDQRKAEDRKQEELRNIQQEMLEESQRKSQEQLEALQKKIEAGNQ